MVLNYCRSLLGGDVNPLTVEDYENQPVILLIEDDGTDVETLSP